MASTDEHSLMLDDDAEYDIRCQQIRQENAVLLGEFRNWLKKAGLAAATVRSHCSNLDFYLNHFLLYSETLTPADGGNYVGEFLGDWFIHKAMWSNKTTVKAKETLENPADPRENGSVITVYGWVHGREAARIR